MKKVITGLLAAIIGIFCFHGKAAAQSTVVTSAQGTSSAWAPLPIGPGAVQLETGMFKSRGFFSTPQIIEFNPTKKADTEVDFAIEAFQVIDTGRGHEIKTGDKVLLGLRQVLYRSKIVTFGIVPKLSLPLRGKWIAISPTVALIAAKNKDSLVINYTPTIANGSARFQQEIGADYSRVLNGKITMWVGADWFKVNGDRAFYGPEIGIMYQISNTAELEGTVLQNLNGQGPAIKIAFVKILRKPK